MPIAALWKPQPGDRIRYTRTVFGEPLDSEIWSDMTEIVILRRESGVEGYWHATNPNGETRTMTTEDMLKTSCEWLPWPHQIVDYTMVSLNCSLSYVLRELSRLAVYRRELSFDDLCQDFLTRLEVEIKNREMAFSGGVSRLDFSP
jgi:hypothetical protein